MNINSLMHDNFSVNFSLKGITSILIGLYIFIASYAIKFILDGFLIDNSTVGMLSIELIEMIVFFLAFFVFLFSSLAFFFRGKRLAKRFRYTLWNQKTKVAFWKYIISIVAIFLVLFLLKQQGYIDFITPIFLILYAVLLFLFRNKENKNYLILPALCLVLGTLCFLIPSYWYASLNILGIAHITYGVVVRN
ncbi:hypothetical protein JL193_13150 [Polaribacter batillariae]|uniref:Tripartite tricarboxylate transporter TctB family protein n=1 Tax=Polaribacter batillariae TaxID=2808900 RepID=A0ABX7SU99_9FLAO|nr:hypothetical protein [Polaribacter batillariae]QTD37058.1 hypothetical protein JL193_13150 [Polaribacter batillariae]